MGLKRFLTKPDPTETRLPGGVPYIVGNEAAERFSFYGMRAILVVFMTQYLVDASHNDATMTDEQAKSVFHLFVGLAYFTPMLGALIADIFWGKYKTILYISLMYCAGHGCLAMMDLGPMTGSWDMRPFLYSGLFLIALGSGGIKPCVSAHVGDQFGTGNKHLMTQVFNWFYFSINVGAAASQLLTPWLLSEFGPWLAFGLPGVLMGIATFVFWLGRHQFIHVPPAGWRQWKAETLSPAGRRALLNLSPLFLIFVPMFWAIFDQTGSAWVIQADQMNRDMGIVWDPSQIQFVNPIMILCGIPIFTYIVYPFFGKFMKVTPLRKIGVGLFLTAGSFAVSGLVEVSIVDKGPGIARTMYADLTTDLTTPGVLPFDGERDEQRDIYIASIAKAIVSSAESLEWNAAELQSRVGIDYSALVDQIPDSNYRRLLPSADQAVFIESVGLGGDFAQALIYTVEQDWSAEQYAQAGLSLNSIVRSLPDDVLAAQFTVGRLIPMLEGLTTTDRPDLATAVRIARQVWVEEGLGRVKADEAKIVSYLNEMPSILWQFIAYLILTSAEILVSIVCLEFAYTQSPKKMKSLVMGVFFLGVSLANFFVSGVNALLSAYQSSSGVNLLEGASYYWFFCILMLLTAIVYLIWAPFYKGETYIQGEGEEDVLEAEAEAEGTEVR
jgi:POT family proton-dependent oligopeptide transporter